MSIASLPSDVPELPFGSSANVSVGEPPGIVDALPQSSHDLARRLHLPQSAVDDMLWVLKSKRSLILSGPPGVGKSYAARQLAGLFAGARTAFIQLHPSYAYEYFVSGFRPVDGEDGGARFELAPGPLLRMAEVARNAIAPDGQLQPVVLIIDEINRANLSAVFGEVLTGMEYRDMPISLQYGDPLGTEKFNFVFPENLFIIATMNRADRTAGNLDAAMLRRFGVYEMNPTKEPFRQILRKYLEENNKSAIDIADIIDSLNDEIPDPNFSIGGSYFFGRKLDGLTVARILEFEIIPYLEQKFGARWVEEQERLFAPLRSFRPGQASEWDEPSEFEEHELDVSG